MRVLPTGLEGVVEIIPDVFHDERGWFFEFYKAESFLKENLSWTFVQDNISFSKKDVIRGMHMQVAPHDQAKLVTVIQGKVLDVVADLRKGSATFGKTYQCVLDDTRHNMLMIPEGFAHGFAALEDTIFFYKTTASYHADAERGIVWNDPDLNIEWSVASPIISQKDLKLPLLSELLRKSVISR